MAKVPNTVVARALQTIDDRQTGDSTAYSEHELNVQQEGQHPLTGQRDANFRLLANQ